MKLPHKEKIMSMILAIIKGNEKRILLINKLRVTKKLTCDLKSYLEAHDNLFKVIEEKLISREISRLGLLKKKFRIVRTLLQLINWQSASDQKSPSLSLLSIAPVHIETTN